MKITNHNLISTTVTNFALRFVAILFIWMLFCSQLLSAHSKFNNEIDSTESDTTEYSDQQIIVANVTSYNNTIVYISSGAQMISIDNDNVEASSGKSDKVEITPSITKKKKEKPVLLIKKKTKKYKSKPTTNSYKTPFSDSENIRSQKVFFSKFVRSFSPDIFCEQNTFFYLLSIKFSKDSLISYESAIISFASYSSSWVRPPPIS